MADPTKYTPGYDFSNYQANQPNKPLPGDRLDIELADIAEALGGAIDALKDVRRADGKLQNGIVDADSITQDLVDDLAQDVIAAVGPAAEASIQAALPDWRGGWLTATAYAVNDLVREDGSAYICLAAHTSGTFTTDLAAGRWELFAQRGATGVGTGDMLGANNLSDVTDVAVARSNIGLGGDILPAIAGLDTSAGFLAQTGASTAGKRSMAGTANQIAVANPDGSGGNPTFSLVLPSQAEAEAGTDNNKPMTALRVAQAITARAPAPTPSVPAGTVLYLARNSPPTGYLKANGAQVSRTDYADLFAAIGTTFGAGNGSTTFTLPDLRGEFIRGWSDGRSVDSGRTFGSAQSQDIQSHSHTITKISTTSSGVDGVREGPSDGVTSTGAAGGAETRPRNIALLAVIKF